MLVGRSCAFHQQPDLYDELLKCLDYDRIVPVTLNYDLLFEEAILRSEQRFTYPEIPGVGGTVFTSDGEGDAVEIYKLHGSVNWTAPSGAVGGTDLAFLTKQADAQSTKLLPSPTGGIARQTFATYVPHNRHGVFLELERPFQSYGPVVGIFASGKPVLENPTHLDQHRRACERALTSVGSADVLAVGVSIPPRSDDDPILGRILDLFATVDGTKTYVSPSGPDCERFEQRGFQIRKMGLEDWLVAQPSSTDR